MANWFFLPSVDYFDGPGKVTSLLNTWLLVIEGQFYFIFPVLIVFFAIRKKSLAIAIYAAITTGFFAYAFYLISQNDADAAFYKSAARFWELMIGSMLAVWNPARPKKIISDAAEFIGIALIGYSLLLFNKHTVFPGLSAALPTIGTALLMFAGGNGRGFSQVLKSKSMVWIGLVSYSLYLWHWPIIVFIKLINPGAEAGLMAFGLFVSLLASIFSYIYVENCLEKSV